MKRSGIRFMVVVFLGAACAAPALVQKDGAQHSPVPSAVDLRSPASPTPTPSPSPKPAKPHLPAIVVDGPKSGDRVPSAVRVFGTADIFEASVTVRILDENDDIIAEVRVQASCGTGCVGDFSATIDYHVAHDQPGKIQAFDYSSNDGSIENLTSVDVTLSA